MNDSPEDIFSLLNLSSLAPPAIEDNNVLLGSNWQVSAESKNEISSLSVPVVALNDGRFVLQANDGQFYLLAMSSNYANEEESLPEIETNYSIPNATTFHESEAVADEVESEVNTVSVDEEPEKVIEPSDTSSSPLVEGGEEQFLFICAQCSNLFLSVEKCRDHMIKDHNMIISNEIPEVCDEDREFVQLPLQSIDTNSGNKEKSPTNTETTTNNIVKNDGQEKSVQENVDQENSGVKDKKSEENGDEMKEKEGKQSKKVAKANNRKRKEIASDPDYELRPFKCRHSSCVHRFRSEEALHHHTMCHTTPTRREYACSQADCNMKFDDWRHCAIHLWNLHHIDVDLHTCLICGQHKATSRKALETHMRIHGEERQFVCPECGKAFKQKSQLYNHRVTHIKKKMSLIPDAVTPRWYMEKQCTICQKVYADSKCLKKHVQAVHSKLKPYVCQVCGHSAARKAMLQAHLRQHTGEKPYACTTCDFKTGDHNSLRRHMMRHSGVKPYKCPHCSYASIQSTSFKNHLAIRHPGKEGVFECQRCAYRTVSHASYLQHCNDHNNNLINSSATGAGADQQGDVEVFPENVAAAQLIYQCLSGAGGKGSAMGGRGGGATAPFKADVTASSTSGDGTKQTITIEIPTNTSEILTTDDEDTTHCFLQPDVIDSGGITIPADPHPHPTAIVPPSVTQPSTRIITHLIEFS